MLATLDKEANGRRGIPRGATNNALFHSRSLTDRGTCAESNSRFVPHRHLYLRPTIGEATCQLGVSSSDSYFFFVVTREMTLYPGPHTANGLTILFPGDDVRRTPPGNIKHPSNYWRAYSLRKYRKACGADELLFLSPVGCGPYEDGSIAETSGSIPFFYVDDRIFTPTLSACILPSITRKTVIAILQSWGLKPHEEFLPADVIPRSDEIFVAGTWTRIAPTDKILHGLDHPVPFDENSVYYGAGPGPLTLKLQTVYNALVEYDPDTVAKLASGLDVPNEWHLEVPD